MRELIEALIRELSTNHHRGTRQVTSNIKSFIVDWFKDGPYYVHPSKGSKEYMIDIIVSNFHPRRMLEVQTNSMLVVQPNTSVHLAIESELGGSGGGSQSELQKNVIEDFIKLLLINSENKIFICTSLRYKNEDDYIKKRVGNLHNIYLNSNSKHQTMYIVHIRGDKNKRSNQVKITPIDDESFSVYKFCSDGKIRKLNLNN